MSKSIVRSIKNVASGYSSVQVKVRNATSNDPSGPTTYDMEEIARLTYQSQTEFLEVMDMLDRRLNDKGKNWRHIAKSLTVLDYLVRFGSEKCVLWAKDNLYIVKTLREFIHFDELNNDQGAIIRVKAKELVSLLRDDERLRQERELAASKNLRKGRRRREGRSRSDSRANPDEAYDEELQRALELSRLTADQEKSRSNEESDDPELQAALKLSMEEEEMRKRRNRENENLLDLNDEPQNQYIMATGYYQPQYIAAQQQYDMFGNPIQIPMETGFNPQYYQQQQAQAQAQAQYQQPQFTGFNYGQPQQLQQPQQPQPEQQTLQPLKTGSNNPFALNSSSSQQNPQSQSLLDLQYQQQQEQLKQQQAQLQQQQQQEQIKLQQQEQQLQQQQRLQLQQQQLQQQQQLKQQSTSSSKYNDSTHSELNNLLAQGTGIDTFGNTGDTRIPHHYTKTQNFLGANGTGYRQTNSTGNPFLSNGTSYSSQQQQQPINAAYTGYGFGNANTQAPKTNNNDGPSLIDI